MHQALEPQAWRGAIAHALSEEETQFWEDGGLLIGADGCIEACDDWKRLEAAGLTQKRTITRFRPGHLLIPGFIDLHVHLPQITVTGCQANDLEQWLETHVFPEEARFASEKYARLVSRYFFKQLLLNGTTTAAVFLSSHPEASHIAFEEASRLGNRVVMGQNLMDIGPEPLIRPASAFLAETEALCRRWHGVDAGRIHYAWMPRFALSCTDPLMERLGELRQRYPDVYLHTHLSEQHSEIASVLARFPANNDYTSVYERFRLLGPRTILAHGIHLSDSELDRIQKQKAALAHCPGSNFFLKSGRFRWFEAQRRHVLFGLGSDVGAGPELSLFKVMRDAQAMQMDPSNNPWISPQSLFYRATLGGAEALMQADRIGNFLPGKEADFIVINTHAKPGMDFPKPETAQSGCDSSALLPSTLEAMLSRCIYLGDDRLVQSAYIRGRNVYSSERRMRVTSISS